MKKQQVGLKNKRLEQFSGTFFTKLMFYMALILMFSTVVSAGFDFDNFKEYNKITREVTIKNLFGLGKTFGVARLNTPLNVKVPVGYQKVAEFDISAHENYRDAIKSFTFVNLKDKKNIVRDYDLKYLTKEKVLVEDFGNVEIAVTENKTVVYGWRKIGEHYEVKNVWKTLKEFNLNKGEKLTVGVFTNVEKGDHVDWVPTIYGVKIDEWASWEDAIVMSPTMTSNTEPAPAVMGGDALAEGSWYNLYDRDEGQYINFPVGVGKKIVLDMGEGNGFVATNFTFTGYSGTAAMKDFGLEGSNDNSTWAVLTNGTVPNADANYTENFIDNTDSYRYYRLTAINRQDNSGGNIYMWEGYIWGYNASITDNPPNITLNSPTADANYTAITDLTFNFTAFDDINLSDVKLYINDGLNQTNASGINDSIYLFDVTLRDGDYTIYGKATDNASQETNSDSYRFVVDTTAPIISIENATNLTAYTPLPIKSIIRINGTDTNIDDCYYNTTDNSTYTVVTCNDYSNISWSTIGDKTIQYCANDTFGFENCSTTLINVYLDTASPNISIENVTNLTAYLTMPINSTIRVNATDADNLDNCWISYIANGSNFDNDTSTWIGEGTQYNFTNFSTEDTGEFIIDTVVPGGYHVIRHTSNSLGYWTTPKDNMFCNYSEILDGDHSDIRLDTNVGKYVCMLTAEGKLVMLKLETTYPNWTFINKDVVTCNTYTNISWESSENKFISYCANDTAENYNCSSAEVNITYYELLNESYISTTTSGMINSFNATFNSPEQITIAYLNYNGTNYLGSISSSGDTYVLSKNKEASIVDAETNITFYWNITTAGGNNFVTTSHNQTVIPLVVNETCGAGMYVVYNFTLLDERTQLKINETGNSSTVDINLNLYNSDRSTQITNFSHRYSSTNPVAICISNNLSDGGIYSLDLQVKYDGANYSEEYYNIRNYNLNASSLNQSINLYELDDTNAQKFKLIIKDSSYLPIDQAIVRIERKYVENGTFYVTEIPITDSLGFTSASLEVDDVIYNFYIYDSNNNLISSFENVRAICQTPLVTECSIDFNAFQTGINIPSSSDRDFEFTLGYNETTKSITSTFNIPSGTPATIYLEVIREDVLGTAVCSDTLTSASGTLSCLVPSSFGNSTVLAKVYRNSIEQGRGNLKLDQNPSDIFGVILVFLSVLVMMTLIGIGISDNPIISAVFLFVGVLLLFAMNLVKNNGFIGRTATILFLAIAIILIVIKAARRT